MVCFSNENAVNKVLNMSPNLCRSALYGHIYVKRDLPRNQRPSANRRNANVFAEVGRGGGTSDARDQHSSDAGDDENDLSDIDSESDFSDTDQDRSSDDDYDTVVETDAMLTWDELSRNEEVGETSRNEDEGEGEREGAASQVHTPVTRFISTANIVLMSTRPSLEIQGAAASENSECGETN